MRTNRYLEAGNFVFQSLFNALPFLRQVFDALPQRLQKAGVAQSAESCVAVSYGLHFGLDVDHVVVAFLLKPKNETP